MKYLIFALVLLFVVFIVASEGNFFLILVKSFKLEALVQNFKLKTLDSQSLFGFYSLHYEMSIQKEF